MYLWISFTCVYFLNFIRENVHGGSDVQVLWVLRPKKIPKQPQGVSAPTFQELSNILWV